MDAAEFHDRILHPGLVSLQRVTGIPDTDTAARFMLAIALQESALAHRYQVYRGPANPGPARGWWQFERGGGVAGVLSHRTTRGISRKWCEYCAVEPYSYSVWRAMEGHDLLAVGFARLLLWTLPKALPKDRHEAWKQYANDLWRPGKPHPNTWLDNWDLATKALYAGTIG